MRKVQIALAFVYASLSPTGAAFAARPVNPVVQWNRTLLGIVRTPGVVKTIHPTRSFAIMHAAIYDAVNSIDRTREPYLVTVAEAPATASQDAATASAAHAVLVALYPSFQAMLDARLQESLAELPAGSATTDGASIGQTVADRVLALRAGDGSAAQPPAFVFGSAPGDYQSTPPNFPPQPQFTHWAAVTPFALKHADQFRPKPPPALKSRQYAVAFDETKSLGVMDGTMATPDQALTGKFWNGAIQNYWNEIAQTASIAHGLGTAENARLFTLLDFAFADGVIAFYDAKYTYDLWRPVTAIRTTGTDGRRRTEADPTWLPEVTNTTPDPSYPGAHATISAAGAAVLIDFFGTDRFDFDVTSEVLPGVERSFGTFSAAATEATESRIFAGVHFRFDLSSGRKLGRHVAAVVLHDLLRPVGTRRPMR